MAAKQTDPDRLAYSRIERALALVFAAGDPKAQRGWLRGRVRNLGKLGLAPNSAGAGRAISYTGDDADRWLLGLEFGFLHIDPSTTVAFIQKHWPEVQRLIEEARGSNCHENDVVLTVQFSPVMAETPDIWRTTIRGLAAVGHSLREHHIGLSIFNLSALVRAFDKALIEAARPPPPEPTDPTARAILAAAKKARGSP